MNKVILVGNVGQEPQLRYTPAGIPVCDFPMATNERWVGGDGQQRERTTWIRITCWRRQAEVVAEYLTKGRQVCIEGKLGELRPWTDQGGNIRCDHEVTAASVEFLGAPTAMSNQPHPYEPEAAPNNNTNDPLDDLNDENDPNDDDFIEEDEGDYDDNGEGGHDEAALEEDDPEAADYREGIITQIEQAIDSGTMITKNVLAHKFEPNAATKLFNAFTSAIYNSTRDWLIAEMSIPEMALLRDALTDQAAEQPERQQPAQQQPASEEAPKPRAKKRKAAPKNQPAMAVPATNNGSLPASAYPNIDDSDIPF